VAGGAATGIWVRQWWWTGEDEGMKNIHSVLEKTMREKKGSGGTEREKVNGRERRIFENDKESVVPKSYRSQRPCTRVPIVLSCYRAPSASTALDHHHMTQICSYHDHIWSVWFPSDNPWSTHSFFLFGNAHGPLFGPDCFLCLLFTPLPGLLSAPLLFYFFYSCYLFTQYNLINMLCLKPIKKCQKTIIIKHKILLVP
jgi:hypothetical protein